MKELTGTHAVRSLYLLSGATDLYLENGGDESCAAVETLWADTVATKLYVTGGLGALRTRIFRRSLRTAQSARLCRNLRRHRPCLLESAPLCHGPPQPLHGRVGVVALQQGDARRLAGRHDLFLQQPAGGARTRRRRASLAWRRRCEPFFQTTCCPTNMVRLLASLPRLLLRLRCAGIYVHLYAAERWIGICRTGPPSPWCSAPTTPGAAKSRSRSGLSSRRALRFLPHPELEPLPACPWAASLAQVQSGAYYAVTREWQAGDVLSSTWTLRPASWRLTRACPGEHKLLRTGQRPARLLPGGGQPQRQPGCAVGCEQRQRLCA